MYTSESTKNSESSQGKVAWITGSGAARVGRTIAKEFADHGYRIVLHANRSLDEATTVAESWQSEGIDVHVVGGDISSEDFAQFAVQEILHRFGSLDVLVHSAAIWEWKSIETVTAADVSRQWEVNTLGAFLCARSAGLAMVKQPTGGSIVLIGDWAVERPYRDFSSYFVSKGGIETIARSLAVEFGTRNPNIRVNAVLPGPVMLDPSISDEKAEQIRQLCLLKRHGTPEDVARACRFLAEQPFITGVSLPVDGGRRIFAGDAAAGGASADAIAHPTFAS